MSESNRKNKKIAKIKGLTWAVFSILIVLSLQAYIAVIQTDDNNSWVLDILRKINNSYSRIELYDLLMMATLPLVYRYLDKKGSKRDWRRSVLAAVFAVLYALSRSLQSVESLAFFNANSYQMIYSLLCLVGWFLLFDLILNLVFTLAGKEEGEETKPWSGKGLFLMSFAVIFLCWLPWILSNYPGTFCKDSANQIQQYFGAIPWTSYSPVFNTWLMGTLISLGDLIWDRNFGCFLYLLMQTALGAAVFAFGVRKAYSMGAGKAICIGVTAFFALAPMWGLFAQWYEKDLLYAELATLNLLYGFDIVRTRTCSKKTAILLSVSGVLMSLARNNGIYAAVPLLFALALYMKKADRRRAIIALSSVLALYILATSVVFPGLGVEGGSIRDLLGIPAQQTARYVVACGDEVTDEEREAIDAVFAYDQLKELYVARNADNIKDTYKEDASKLPTYFKTWFTMGFKHPAIYAEAFIAKSYGYLAPVERDTEVHVMHDTEDLTDFGISNELDPRFARGFEFISKLGINLPIINYLMSPGLYTWFLIACIVLLRAHKKNSGLIMFIPAVVNVIFCIGSPLHNSIRYMLPVAAAMPFLLVWTWSQVREPHSEKSE